MRLFTLLEEDFMVVVVFMEVVLLGVHLLEAADGVALVVEVLVAAVLVENGDFINA